ncbi:MAG: YkgJ family cysteine cluster protein [Candidatus Margulisiibacteriota bacterium]|jgi:hypothetical protein
MLKNLTQSELQDLRNKVIADFICLGCGNCCKYPGYVYADHEEVKQIAAFLNIFIVDFIDQYTQKENNYFVLSSLKFNPNCFLDQNQKCAIYPVRPKACKTYPDWDYLWNDFRILQNETDLCLGLKKLCF